MREYCSEDGVSEIVGVMLLLGLTIIGVALVGIVFLSNSQPDEIPHATIVAGNESGRLALIHGGGDTLRPGTYRIYVDTGDGLVDRTYEFTGQEDGIWSIGETLVYEGPETPERVVVTAGTGGSETILAEPDFVGEGEAAFSPDPMEPEPGSGPGSGSGSEEDPTSFINYVIDENVFVYGNNLIFEGGTVTGPGATIVITKGLDTKGLDTNDLNGGASIAVSNIYIDGDVTLDGGSAGLGSPVEPGTIYVNGDLTLRNGQRHIYGDVYVAKNFHLKDAQIHGNVYVNGDLTLDWTPWIAPDAHIYYTGTRTTPPNYDNSDATSILAKCIYRTKDWEFEMPDWGMPHTKSADWYTSKGYVSDRTLKDNLKAFAPSYSSTSGNSASNVIIIASNGDISITGGWSTVTGVFFAPNGKVTFDGNRLEGVVIASDGFFATHGGSTVIFRNVEEYITNPADYPF